MTEKRSEPLTKAWSPWRVVVSFGLVSLAADMVYEGARSITGPLLGSLGASALVVGLVTGAGEAIALVLRLVSGTVADRTRRYWTLTIVGYGLTAVCVPLLAVAPLAGGAGLALAIILILLERTGKAIRSPSKSALLAQAAGAVGLGRGFAVHKALDQAGAFAGPLLVAAIIAATAAIWPAMLALAVPGAAAMVLLLRMRTRAPDISGDEAAPPPAREAAPAPRPKPDSAPVPEPGLPTSFYFFAAASGAVTAGLVTFGVISFHLTEAGLVPLAAVPLVYAAAMAAAAAGALATGHLYDRWNARVLFALPLLVSLVPALALADSLLPVMVGIVIWGAAVGIQDSTVKALVADLVRPARRATAYGVFAAVQGTAALAGGGLAGALYDNRAVLTATVGAFQAAAVVLLLLTFRRAARGGSSCA